MIKACLSLLLVTTSLASESGETCIGDTCNGYAAAEVAHMDATSGSAVQLLQRKASEGADGDDDEIEDIDTDITEQDFDYEEDDFGTTDAALVSKTSDEKDECDALDDKYPELVKIDFDLAENSVNNLGGAGPDANDDKMLYYKNAATGDDGESTYDLKVTVMGSYKPRMPKVNGLKGHYGIINVACGTSVDLKFELLDPSSGKPATLKNLIFSWFDLDKGKLGGGLESVTLWPGYKEYVVSTSSEIKQEDVDCPANAGDGTCKLFKATTWGVGKDNPEDPLTLTKQQAARTFATYYSDVSTFHVTLSAGDGFGSRNFLFTGMSQVAYGAIDECCPDHICSCQDSCSESSADWSEKCTNAKCADCNECVETTTTTTQGPASKEETCKNGLTFELTEDRLKENTLGKKENGRLLYKNILSHEGRTIDLSVTDAAGAPKYNGGRLQGFKPDSRNYTGAYKTAGRIAFEQAGRYMLRFTFLDTDSGKPVKLPLFPFSLFDIDGKGEIVSVCNVAAVILAEDSNLIERQDERCYSHISTKNEVNIPGDFDSLTKRQKKHTVTYVYRDSASWDLGVTLGPQEERRYILFKSSKVLACDYEDKAGRDKPWKRNPDRKGDA